MPSRQARILEVVASAPILAALLLGSLPVLLVVGVWRRMAQQGAAPQ